MNCSFLVWISWNQGPRESEVIWFQQSEVGEWSKGPRPEGRPEGSELPRWPQWGRSLVPSGAGPRGRSSRVLALHSQVLLTHGLARGARLTAVCTWGSMLTSSGKSDSVVSGPCHCDRHQQWAESVWHLAPKHLLLTELSEWSILIPFIPFYNVMHRTFVCIWL